MHRTPKGRPQLRQNQERLGRNRCADALTQRHEDWASDEKKKWEVRR